ncbi:Histidine triad nucleotide-binding protein 3 [Orbilia blumenaviensis]|uniref:Histidine triad nucleotide-binding protein 3 n=1 Tax=Orbilia blumenaviensis TaxID=1796055 RepID=A0AAV9VAL2_9PEZI
MSTSNGSVAAGASSISAPQECTFCKGDFIVTAELYRDDELIVIDDRRPAGKTHWLVMPLRHIRSVEDLTPSDLPLYRKMLALSEQLLAIHHPNLTPASRYHRLRIGFHRGKRDVHVVGPVKFHVPDVISVKHLHLHVIVDIDSTIKALKYPLWNELIFAKSETVLRRLEDEEKRSKDTSTVSKNNEGTDHTDL